MSTAFVFPGQGSQSVGMLAALAAKDAVVPQTFAEASDVLGYDLWQRVSEGPADALNATECTQPAMLAAGVATWRAWRNAGGAVPDRVLGHSLGEFTALVAAEALEFPRAVALVRERARLMQAAVPAGVGAMAAVLGLDDDKVIDACMSVANDEVVQAVNFNSPGQVVIAGHATAVNRAIEKVKSLGAKRAVLLPISVPAHSALLEQAAKSFRASIDAAGLRAPRIEFWSPSDVKPHSDPHDVADVLQHQLAQAVRWTDTVTTLIDHGITRFIECGPGEVLAGLVKRIGKGRGIESLAISDPASIDSARTLPGGAS